MTAEVSVPSRWRKGKDFWNWTTYVSNAVHPTLIKVVTAVQVFHVKNVGASITLQRFISTGTTTQQQQMITQFSKQRTRRQGAMLNTHPQRRMAGSLGASSNLFLRLVQAVPRYAESLIVGNLVQRFYKWLCFIVTIQTNKWNCMQWLTIRATAL